MANEEGRVGLNLQTYAAQRTDGSAVFQRLGPDTYQVVMKQFCPSTGKELPPAVVQVTRNGLADVRAVYEREIATRQEFIAGIDAIVADANASDVAAAPAQTQS